jgi:hypothetical protein
MAAAEFDNQPLTAYAALEKAGSMTLSTSWKPTPAALARGGAPSAADCGASLCATGPTTGCWSGSTTRTPTT